MTLALGTDTASRFTNSAITGTPFSVAASERMSSLVQLVQSELDAETRRAARSEERRRERLTRFFTVGAFAVGTGWAIYFAQLLLVH